MSVTLSAPAQPATTAARVRQLVCIAAGNGLAEDDLEAAGGSLADVGLDSIGFMNLLESLETAFGVVIDPEDDPSYLTSVDRIVEFLDDQLAPAPESGR